MGRDWTKWGAELTGQRFAEFHTTLAKFNATRFNPGLPEDAPDDQLSQESRVAAAEIALVESLRTAVMQETLGKTSHVTECCAREGRTRAEQEHDTPAERARTRV